MRPANLDLQLTDELRERVRVLRARDDDPAGLAAALWDLPGWARTGHRLLDDMSGAADVPARFVGRRGHGAAPAADPVLPTELLPDDWPGAALRLAYHDFAAELVARRDDTRLMEAT